MCTRPEELGNLCLHNHVEVWSCPELRREITGRRAAALPAANRRLRPPYSHSKCQYFMFPHVAVHYSPTPRGLPEFMSRLNGNSLGSCFVVSMTMLSIDISEPRMLISMLPLVPWMAGLIIPAKLWLSDDGTSFSVCHIKDQYSAQYASRKRALSMNSCMEFHDHPSSPVNDAYRLKSSLEPRV